MDAKPRRPRVEWLQRCEDLYFAAFETDLLLSFAYCRLEERAIPWLPFPARKRDLPAVNATRPAEHQYQPDVPGIVPKDGNEYRSKGHRCIWGDSIPFSHCTSLL